MDHPASSTFFDPFAPAKVVPLPGNGRRPQQLEVKNMADVAASDVDWLWPGRLARGQLTIIAGAPGVGKGWLQLALMTALSLGAPLPGASAGAAPAPSLLCDLEDDDSHVLRPRIDMLGGDPSYIDLLTGHRLPDGTLQPFNLGRPDDLRDLERVLGDRPYQLLSLDPIDQYLPANLDANRGNAVRAVLMPVVELLRRRCVAGLGILHLTKGERERALYRLIGSIAFAGLARIVFIMGTHHSLPADRRVLACAKTNLGISPPSIVYSIPPEGGLHWLPGDPGEALTDEDLVAPPPRLDSNTAKASCERAILELLQDGPVTRTRALAELAGQDYSDGTIGRAVRDLERAGRLVRHTAGFGATRQARWGLPGDRRWDEPAE